MDNYTRYEDGQPKSYKKIILALVEQCKNDGLTVSQALFVLGEAKREVKRQVNRGPLPP